MKYFQYLDVSQPNPGDLDRLVELTALSKTTRNLKPMSDEDLHTHREHFEGIFTLKRLYAETSCGILIVRDPDINDRKQSIRGVLSYTKDEDDNGLKIQRIMALYTLPPDEECNRDGAARILVKKFADIVKDLGYRRAIVTPAKGSEKAYTALGFKQAGESSLWQRNFNPIKAAPPDKYKQNYKKNHG
jgi:hypothetical protein